MSFFSKMIDLQLVLFFMMCVGIVLNKTGVITFYGRKSISDLLIGIMLPASVLGAFLGTSEFTPELRNNCIIIFVVSAVTEILGIMFGGRIFKRFGKERQDIMHYGMIVSNTAYIGLPVAGALFGDTGILYTSVYYIPGEIAMWTYALSLFKKDNSENVFKMVFSAPAADAVFLGLIIMLLRIPIPEFIKSGVISIGSCTTPVSMMVIGAILADGDYKKIFSVPGMMFSVIRLIIFPILIFIPMKLLALDTVVIGIGVIMAAMPAAAATSILADKYDSDYEFATDVVILSTLMSIVTIPLITLLL